MGNSQTSKNTNDNIQYFHQKFKTIQISETACQMTLSIPFQQKIDILEWQRLLKEVKNCDSQFLLMPKRYMIADQGLCGSSGIIKIVYDSFSYSFQQEIKNHAQKYKHFQEAQIWYLLFAMISSAVQMERVTMKVGDIRPYNIFVNQNGQVKLSGVFSWPKQIQNFLKTSYDKTVTYLSPEELLQCRTGQKKKQSYIIGQSFSIGLTLLHTCLLKSMEELYNIKKFEFKSEQLRHYIQQLRTLTFWNEEKQINQKYSDSLINIVQRLLALDQNRRLTSLQLFSKLQPHAEQILNLRQFQIPLFQTQNNNHTQQHSRVNSRFSPQKSISQQYSSIKKKQYNEGDSIGLEMSYGPGYNKIERQNSSGKNIVSHPVHHFSPAKNEQSRSRQKVILNSQYVTIQPRTSHYPRESLSKDKHQSNTYVKFNNSNGPTQSKTYQFQPTVHRSSIYHPPKTQTPSFTIPPSNYVSYQATYEQPRTTALEYRNSSQPAQVFFNQGNNHTYHKTSYQNPITRSSPHKIISNNVNPYPFSSNIDLTTSGYTYRKSSDKNNTVTNGNISTYMGTTAFRTPPVVRQSSFQTSTVRPVNVPSTYEPTKNNQDQPDFLKKIDQQLNKSRQMYPSSKI